MFRSQLVAGDLKKNKLNKLKNSSASQRILMRQAQLRVCESVKSGTPGGETRLFPGNADAEAASCYYRQIITGGGKGGEGAR